MNRREVFAAGPVAPVPSRRIRVSYRVTQLLRGEGALHRGAEATRRLLEVVQGLPAGCTVDVTVGRLTARSSGMRIDVAGDVPSTFTADLRWVFEHTAVLAPTRAASLLPPPWLAEITADRAVTPWAAGGPAVEPPTDAMQAELLRQRALRLQTPWPRPRYADLSDLLALNQAAGRDAPGVVVRYRLAAAGSVEQQLVAEDVHHHWDPERGDPHEYVGRPVRVRAFVGTRRGELPTRVRAVVRQWGSALDLRPLDHAALADAWSGDAASLVGHAHPQGIALALVRLPAAVDGFPGLATADAPVQLRVLDPVPARPSSGIRLGRARTATGAWTDVHLGLTDLCQHVFVQGATGSGKSTLLASICLAVQASGAGYTLLDPEGSTVDMVLSQTDRQYADSVSVVRHGHLVLDAPLNLLAEHPEHPEQLERMLDLFAEMIQLAQDPENKGMVGPRWRRWFSLVARATALVYGEEATLVTVAAISSDMDRVRELAKAVAPLDGEIAHRLSSEYGRLGSENAADMVSWGVSKLAMLLTSERARWIFGAGPDAVDVRAAMDEGMSLLIDLGAHRLGEPVGRIIGVTYLLKFWAALGLRDRRDRQHYIVVDEAHLFSYGPLPKLLAEARKFGVGVIVATQHLGQLTGELGDALESNTGSFVSLRAGLQSAGRASARLDGWPIAELVRMPNLTAAATLSRDGVATEPFSLVVDHHDRMRQAEAAGRIGSDVAEGILAECAEVTSAYAALPAPSDEAIMAVLRRPARRPKPDRPAEMELDEVLTHTRSSSILDDWMAQRGSVSGD